jgi:hypothetical protein
MNKKYCCDTFKIHYLTEKGWGLNIRVIKLSDSFVKRGDLKFDKVYYITEGYENNIGGDEKRIVINYCPFCGINLQKFYGKDDAYVQEIMDV